MSRDGVDISPAQQFLPMLPRDHRSASLPPRRVYSPLA
jgi:hypothetical protein